MKKDAIRLRYERELLLRLQDTIILYCVLYLEALALSIWAVVAASGMKMALWIIVSVCLVVGITAIAARMIVPLFRDLFTFRKGAIQIVRGTISSYESVVSVAEAEEKTDAESPEEDVAPPAGEAEVGPVPAEAQPAEKIQPAEKTQSDEKAQPAEKPKAAPVLPPVLSDPIGAEPEEEPPATGSMKEFYHNASYCYLRLKYSNIMVRYYEDEEAEG